MNTPPKRSAAPDVGRGGAETRFPTISQHACKPPTDLGSIDRRAEIGRIAKFTHRLNTPFLRGEDPSPAAEDLKRIRGRRLAGEPASGWGYLEDRS